MIKDRNERINFMLEHNDRNKYQPLMKEQFTVAGTQTQRGFDPYRFTKMAEQLHQWALDIAAGVVNGSYEEMCWHLEGSWYYLLCAAECGELE